VADLSYVRKDQAETSVLFELIAERYQTDLLDFMGFIGIAQPDEFRLIMRAHVLAW
jgi:hypothetical protein